MSKGSLPSCEVLIVSTDVAWLEGWSQRLQTVEDASEDLQGVCYLRVESAADPEDARAFVRQRGKLQAVIIDAVALTDHAALVADLRAIRSEIDLFVAVSADGETNDTACEVLDRNDTRAEILLRRVRSAIARRARTPFADTLRDYVSGARDAWHTPGHSSGDGLRESPWVADFYRMMGEHVFNADLSVSVKELDSLLDPSHVIQSAQNLAADAFGAQRTFFVTGGTSMANKVIVQHVLGNGGKMLVDQSCHKSVHHAAVLFGVDPIYLPASVNTRYGLYGPVPKASIMQAIDHNPDAGLLVLTSCSYDGFYYDLAPIIAHAQAAGMQVLVDEAWYAHGYFHPGLRPCALECGADFVTQSTHKMLSAFSQASMIHVNDRGLDEARFREHLNMHTSTSPQYALIASLDVARKQMSMEGFLRLSRCIDFAEQLRSGIAETGCFRVLSLEDMLPSEVLGDRIRLDPTKLTIDLSASHYTARELQRLLYERFSIQVEKITHNTLSILVTLGATKSKVLRLLSALSVLAQEDRGSADKPEPPPSLPALGEICKNPRSAYFADSVQLPLADGSQGINPGLLGRISADQIVPYPPGIPVLVPGQRISEDVLTFLLHLVRSDVGMELHGLSGSDACPLVRVVGRRADGIAAAQKEGESSRVTH